MPWSLGFRKGAISCSLPLVVWLSCDPLRQVYFVMIKLTNNGCWLHSGLKDKIRDI